ncbi:hypothetical protein QAD02_006000 [Eretmocerus hayati]|uniref:Uncharacterized protein n=1 Tax=Eretmocerus hayati TaxID=131215 RepID=A0ACC2N0S7_9HYME|nr:hypothetical protein QAD02_006000 [Eretmocerus hayati]
MPTDGNMKTHRDFDLPVYLELEQVISDGNIELLQNLINARFGIQNKRNGLCLYTAIESCNTEIVKILLKAGIDREYHTVDEDGVIGPEYSPLYVALEIIDDRETRVDMVKLLVENGVDPKWEILYDRSCIFQVAQSGDCEMLKYLFDAGADVNYPVKDEEKFSPLLHVAVKNLDGQNREEMVKLLIDCKVDVNATTRCGHKTCLHVLSESGKSNDCEIFEMLLSAGADLNLLDLYGASPLALAAYQGNLELMKLMIAAQADVNLARFIGSTPLYRAVSRKDRDVVQLLLENEADPNIFEDNLGILSEAAHSSFQDRDLDWATRYYDTLKLLLAHGAQFHDSETHKENVPFTFVLSYGTMEAVHLFFEYGVTLENCGVRHPLHQAAINNCDSRILEYLLKSHRYDVDEIEHFNSCERTALYEADSVENARLLINWGANPNIRCIRFGITTSPIYDALKRRYKEKVDILFSAGAKINMSPDDELWKFVTHRQSIAEQREFLSPIIGEFVLLKSQNQLDATAEDALIDKFPITFLELKEQCSAELNELKTITFYGSVTLYDILRGKDVTRFVKNIHVGDTFESLNVLERFPIYGNRINNSYLLAKVRRDVIDEATKKLNRLLLFRFCNHHGILSTIISHLSLKDLHTLCNL